MRVYVEVVLINNLAVDALLVYATLAARRRKVRKVRFCVAVAAGAAVAVGYPLMPEWGQTVTGILLAPLMTAVFDKYSGVKDYIISLAVFAGLTFVAGGAIYGGSALLGIDLAGYPVLGAVSLSVSAALVAVRLAVATRAKRKRRIREAKIVVGGREFAAEALCDSGNTLTDTVSGLPVFIVSEKFAECVDGWHGEARAGNIEGFVEVVTVSGRASLPIAKVDSVDVDGRVTRAYAALSERNFEGYEVILQNTMF